MAAIDQPKKIRDGEEFESAKIEEFLKDTIPGIQGQMLVQQFPGGRSNLTYLVTFGDRELVLRRPINYLWGTRKTIAEIRLDIIFSKREKSPNRSRAWIVCDPERFLDDEAEPMSKVGMKVVYKRTSNGLTLRSGLSDKF